MKKALLLILFVLNLLLLQAQEVKLISVNKADATLENINFKSLQKHLQKDSLTADTLLHPAKWMLKLQNKLSKQQRQDSNIYIFFCSSETDSIKAFLPLSGKYGYVLFDTAKTGVEEFERLQLRLSTWQYQWDAIHDPQTMLFAFMQDEEEGAMMAASDECWEKGRENWTSVTPQKYKAKKKLEYDATCSYIYSSGLYRTYFNITDGNILIVDQVYRNNVYSSDPDDVIDVYHFYISELNEWFEVDINTFETECLSCDLNYIAAEITKLAGTTIGRYVLPIEDVYILLEGKDFDGVQANRTVAGGFILIEFIPGGKILKPVTKGLKAGTKATVKGTRKIYKLVKGSKVVVGEFADDVLKPAKWIDGDVDEIVEVLQDVTYATVDGKEVKGAIQVVKKGDEVGFRLAKFTTKEVDEIALAATKNSDSDKLILGKYVKNSPLSYDEVAKKGNYTYFNLDNWEEVAKSVGHVDDEMWKINKKFIDNQRAAGKEIFFSHDPWKEIDEVANSYFLREIEYLMDLECKNIIKVQDNLWKAIW